jgi:hypothetical protein
MGQRGRGDEEKVKGGRKSSRSPSEPNNNIERWKKEERKRGRKDERGGRRRKNEGRKKRKEG